MQLFNGKNLNGWAWVARPPRPSTAPGAAPSPTTQPLAKLEDVWSVNDGVLISSGRPIGYIRTDQKLPANYVLTVEMRHIARGNGGILVGITGLDKVWPHCIEVQGASDNVGDFYAQGELKLTADPARVQQGRHVLKLAPPSEKPVGEWDSVEIVVESGNVSVKVNGTLQNVGATTEDLAGMVGLQAEGAPMEFRKVEFRPIHSR
ncbi:MAG TPA: DUF1080 domain-containing protein [Tepidisphaeraceae bacterium]